MALPVLLVSFYDLGFGLGFIFRFSVHYNHPSVRKLWLRRFIGDEGGDDLRGVTWVCFFTNSSGRKIQKATLPFNVQKKIG